MPALGPLLTILIVVAVIVIVMWGITRLMATWEVDGKIQTTVYIFMVVLFAIWLLFTVLPMFLPVATRGFR